MGREVRDLEALGDPESVLPMYDMRKSTIGVQRGPASSRSAFRVKIKDSRNGELGGRVYQCRCISQALSNHAVGNAGVSLKHV